MFCIKIKRDVGGDLCFTMTTYSTLKTAETVAIDCSDLGGKQQIRFLLLSPAGGVKSINWLVLNALEWTEPWMIPESFCFCQGGKKEYLFYFMFFQDDSLWRDSGYPGKGWRVIPATKRDRKKINSKVIKRLVDIVSLLPSEVSTLMPYGESPHAIQHNQSFCVANS